MEINLHKIIEKLAKKDKESKRKVGIPDIREIIVGESDFKKLSPAANDRLQNVMQRYHRLKQSSKTKDNKINWEFIQAEFSNEVMVVALVEDLKKTMQLNKQGKAVVNQKKSERALAF